MAASHSHPPIVVTHDENLRFKVQIRGHELIIDQPIRGGGDDAGPAPLELFGSALGACVALYVHQFCKTRELSDEGMRVEVRQHGAVAPNRLGAFEVRVFLPPEIPDQFLPLIERAAQSCPAHHTLTHPATVDISIETAVAAE